MAQVINKVGRDGLVHVFNADDEKVVCSIKYITSPVSNLVSFIPTSS